MPSSLHEGLVQLFRSRPALAAEILAQTLHQALPAYPSPRRGTDLPKLKAPGRRADTVVVLYQSRGKPVLAVVVEVQLGKDPGKKGGYLVRNRARQAPDCAYGCFRRSRPSSDPRH